MKFYNVAASGDGSFGIQETNDGVMKANVQCSGTSLETATVSPNVEAPNFSKETIIANYVDASNFGIVLPPLSGNLAEVEIYAMGPDGVNVTVFLHGGNVFVDSSVSVDIPTGTGKKFRVIGAGSFTSIIGTIG